MRAWFIDPAITEDILKVYINGYMMQWNNESLYCIYWIWPLILVSTIETGISKKKQKKKTFILITQDGPPCSNDWRDNLRPHIIFSLQAHSAFKNSKLTKTKKKNEGRYFITENVTVASVRALIQLVKWAWTMSAVNINTPTGKLEGMPGNTNVWYMVWWKLWFCAALKNRSGGKCAENLYTRVFFFLTVSFSLFSHPVCLLWNRFSFSLFFFFCVLFLIDPSLSLVTVAVVDKQKNAKLIGKWIGDEQSDYQWNVHIKW